MIVVPGEVGLGDEGGVTGHRCRRCVRRHGGLGLGQQKIAGIQPGGAAVAGHDGERRIEQCRYAA